MNEIKPCPFCGGEAEIIYYDPKVVCNTCGAAQYASKTVDDAISSWNRRLEENATD